MLMSVSIFQSAFKTSKVNLNDFKVGGPTRFPTTTFHFKLVVLPTSPQ